MELEIRAVDKPVKEDQHLSDSKMKNRERQRRRPESGRITYAGWQTVVPSSPLPSHALERSAAVQSVTQVAAERDGAARKVTLVADFKSKLWHPRIIAVRQLKTWEERVSQKKEVKGDFTGK